MGKIYEKKAWKINFRIFVSIIFLIIFIPISWAQFHGGWFECEPGRTTEAFCFFVFPAWLSFLLFQLYYKGYREMCVVENSYLPFLFVSGLFLAGSMVPILNWMIFALLLFSWIHECGYGFNLLEHFKF